MYRKLFAIITILAITIFSFSVVLATDDNGGMLQDAANGVRNVVGGAENAVEDGARDIANVSKDATGDMENGASNATAGGTNANSDSNRNTDNNNGSTDNTNGATGATTNGNTGSYTATRTGAEQGATFMGMNSTAWTWLIIGIAGIAIVALVWYYGTQVNNSNDNRE